MSNLRDLLEELRRRKVFRAAAAYAVAAMAVIAAASDILPALGAADGVLTAVVLLALAGLPVTIALAWVYEVQAGRVRRTPAHGAEDGVEEAPAGATDAVGGSGSGGGVRGWRGWRRVAVGVVVLGLIGAAAWGVAVRDGGPAVDADLVVVLPFNARGAEDDVWSEGVGDLLSRKIDASGVLRSADPNAVIGALGGVENDGRGDPAAVAGRLGAGLYLLGSSTRLGDRLQLQASLYDHRGERLSSAEAGPVAVDSVLGALDALAGRLLAPLVREDAGEVASLAALTSRSMPALRAYLRGEQLLRRQQMAAARTAFQEAIAADSGFALAWYSLATAESWSDGREIESIRRAHELAADLPPLERRLIEAHKLQLEGHHRAAEVHYRAVLQLAPELLDAHYNLGEVLFHFGAFSGRSGLEARTHFENALAIRPDHGPSLNHLINIAVAEGRVAEVDSLTRVAESLTPELADLFAAERALVRRDSAALAGPLERLSERRNPGQGLFLSTATLVGDLRAVRSLYLGFARQPDATPGGRMNGLIRAANMQLALGRPRAGFEEMSAAAPAEMRPLLDQLAGQVELALPAIPWFPATAEETRRAGLFMLETSQDEWESRTRNVSGDYTRPDHPWYGMYMLHLFEDGRGHAMAGQWDRALSIVERLDSMPDHEDPNAGSLRQDLVASLQAQIHYRQGDPDLALARLEEMPMEVSYTLVGNGIDFGSERYLRARLLADAGRHEEALRWLGGFLGMSSPASLFNRAPALLVRAGIHDDLGHRESAIRDYAAFLDLWRDVDPELRPLVEGARRRLAALTGEGDGAG